MHDLRLYERAEGVFAHDPPLHDAYRQRQADLRGLQDVYRARLAHAKAAAREMFAHAGRHRTGTLGPPRRGVGAAPARRDAPAHDRARARPFYEAVVGEPAAAGRAPAGRAAAPDRRRGRRLHRRRTRRGAAEPPAPVRPAPAAARQDRSSPGRPARWPHRARRAVPRPPAAGRRQRGGLRGGSRPGAPARCCCRTRAPRLALRRRRPAWRCSRADSARPTVPHARRRQPAALAARQDCVAARVGRKLLRTGGTAAAGGGCDDEVRRGSRTSRRWRAQQIERLRTVRRGRRSSRPAA